MLNLLLGCAIFGAGVLVFWSALPRDGKVSAWITPTLEPYLVVALIAAAALGLILMLAGAVSMLG